MQRQNNKRILFALVVTFVLLACSSVTISFGDDMQTEPDSSATETAQVPQESAPVKTEAPPTKIPPTEITAGAVSTNSVDGLDVVYIPQGSFTMGSSTNYTLRKGFCLTPQHKVTLDSYWITKTEVPVATFRDFIEATGYMTDAESINGGWVWNYGANDWRKVESPDSGPNWKKPLGGKKVPTGLDYHPVSQVSWNDAKAYCEWSGGRLPTEAEWEYAARGNQGARPYPWGSEDINGSLLNFGDKNFKCRLCDAHLDDGFQYTAPVGSFPEGASPFGVLDMAGNVYEWVQDSYDGTSCYPTGEVKNPKPPEGGKERILRGGSYADYDGLYWKLRVDNRWSRLPNSSFADVGIRCVYDTQP